MKQLILGQKIYDFTLWAVNHTGKFPKNHRFSFGITIEQNLIETLSLVQRLNMLGYNQNFINKVDVNIEQLKILFRLVTDLKFINLKSYEFASIQIDEIGRIFGGWIKKLRGEKANKTWWFLEQ